MQVLSMPLQGVNDMINRFVLPVHVTLEKDADVKVLLCGKQIGYIRGPQALVFYEEFVQRAFFTLTTEAGSVEPMVTMYKLA
jgi:hypothetical protein